MKPFFIRLLFARWCLICSCGSFTISVMMGERARSRAGSAWESMPLLPSEVGIHLMKRPYAREERHSTSMDTLLHRTSKWRLRSNWKGRKRKNADTTVYPQLLDMWDRRSLISTRKLEMWKIRPGPWLVDKHSKNLSDARVEDVRSPASSVDKSANLKTAAHSLHVSLVLESARRSLSTLPTSTLEK